MADQETGGSRSVISGPEDGQSLWQPLPSRGYVTVKFSPQTTPYEDFSAGMQCLPPGCHIREHGHRQNHELVFVHEGRGTVTIDDVTSPLEPGSAVLFCRNSRHRIDNTGEVDMKLFWVFMPPGLEDWFNAIGKPRRVGELMPQAFARPEDVASIQDRMHFMPPRG